MRIPPHSEEAERGVLGSILMDSDRVLALLAEKRITADSFYIPGHRILFETLLNASADSKKIDLITVGERLKESGKLDHLGGHSFLDGLIDGTPTSAHAEHYAEIIDDKHTLRKLISIAEAAIDSAYDGVPAKEALAKHQSDALNLSAQEVDDLPMEEHCEAFIASCEAGRCGTVPHFCPEWTNSLGKLSNEIVFLHAPRSTGKTALCIQWIRELHKAGFKAPLLSLESTKASIAPRFIAQEGQVNTFMMKRGAHPKWHRDYETAREASARIRDMKLIVKDGDMAIEAIRAYAVMQKHRGAHIIFIDNLLCIGSYKQFDSRTAMYIYFLGQIRSIRNQINIPIVILAHPNEEGKIAWARDVENLADVIMFLINASDLRKDEKAWRNSGIEDRWLGEQHEHCIVKLQKNREGDTPRFELDFDKGIQTFFPIAQERA